MKLNIKNMLVAALVLGFFGLLYAFLGSQPVMVADSRLRVAEPPLQSPKFAKQSEDESESTFSKSSVVDEATPDLSEGFTEEGSISNLFVEMESTPDEQGGTLANLGFSPESIVVLDNELVNDEVSKGGEIAQSEAGGAVSMYSTTDVAIISDDDFIDLNLVESQSIEMVLIEGDELILEDINDGLTKFRPVLDSDSVDHSSIADMNTVEAGVVESEEEVVATIIIPDVDQKLMTGTDKVSLEYQATMEKLLNVKQQIEEADAENERLKVKFSTVVDQNRELAILIRDIDVKIKTLTTAN